MFAELNDSKQGGLSSLLKCAHVVVPVVRLDVMKCKEITGRSQFWQLTGECELTIRSSADWDKWWCSVHVACKLGNASFDPSNARLDS